MRKPTVTAESHVTVRCAATGPEVAAEVGYVLSQATVADLEAFCAEVRRQGAASDTPVQNVYGDGDFGPTDSTAQVRLYRNPGP